MKHHTVAWNDELQRRPERYSPPRKHGACCGIHFAAPTNDELTMRSSLRTA